MERINIGTFSLEIYDENNETHKEYVEKFESDKDFNTYAEEFWSLLSNVNYAKKQGKYSEIYFAYIDEKIVGMIGLIWVLGSPELVMGILPEMRGNHYSSVLLREYTNYVLETYKEYNELYAYVNPNNVHSQENVEMAGFIRLNEEMYIKTRIR